MSDNALFVLGLSESEKMAVEGYLKSELGNDSVSRKYGELCVHLPMLNECLAELHAEPSENPLEAKYHYLLQRLNDFCQEYHGSISKRPEYDDDDTFERIIFR
jgi:hypothetical protein